MSRFIVLGVALAMLAAGAITTAFKLTHRPALAAPAQLVDPAILHGALQRSREEMALP
jgi:urea transporter